MKKYLLGFILLLSLGSTAKASYESPIFSNDEQQTTDQYAPDQNKKMKTKGFFKRVGGITRKYLLKTESELDNINRCIAYHMPESQGYNARKACAVMTIESEDGVTPVPPQLLSEACTPAGRACEKLAAKADLTGLCRRLCNRVEYKKPGVWAKCRALQDVGICTTIHGTCEGEHCNMMSSKLAEVKRFLKSKEDNKLWKLALK
ncbi:MAG: hypothetical protein WCG05_01850 [Alphaproteobacteria bacterium]